MKVFASGQSNMLGRAVNTSDWSTIDGDVRVWDNINPLGANGTQWLTPVAAHAAGVFEHTDRNNLAVWFCDAVARYTHEPVDLTIVARGASPIALWDPGEVATPMLQACIDAWAATGQGPADVFLWHQGEGDASETSAYYHGAFLALLENLTAAGVIDANTVVILGGIAATSASKLNVNEGHLMPLRGGRIYYATSYKLATSDNTHFTSDALTSLGARRFFSTYLSARNR